MNKVRANALQRINAYLVHPPASIAKFIERNWQLAPITGRSRDNLPNAKQTGSNPYVPVNAPAIGGLFGAFHFDQGVSGNGNHGDRGGNGNGSIASNAQGQNGGKGWWPF
ncbi:hypothetical protein [Paraburkholderia sp. FT54]|uniref:hypothetical protein n=1 Tax=Paraburkholderia sp. FT54 TaxID=3074437 RepID=UPI0038F74553